MDRRRRRWWTIAVTGVSVVIIGAALISGLFQIAVRTVPGYRAQLSAKLETLLGRPVTIGDLRLTWRGYYPSLDLERVTLPVSDPGAAPLAAERLRLAFSLPRLASGNWTPVRIDVVGAELVGSRDEAGKLHLRGFETDGGDPKDALRKLAQLPHLRLTRCVLTWTDQPLKLADHRFEITRADLEQTSDHFDVSIELGLPATLGQTLSMHAELDGSLAETATWSGPWAAYRRGFGTSPLLRTWLAPGATLTAERARLRVKGEVRNGEVPSLTADWESAAINAARGETKLDLKSLTVSAQIALDPQGWSAELRKLDVQDAQGAWPDNHSSVKLTHTGGEDFELKASADFLRLQDLAPWLALVRDVPPELAALRDGGGDIEHLVLRLQRAAGAYRYNASGEVRDLSLPAAQRTAGFASLSGELSLDENGGHLSLRDTPLLLELPHAFTQAVPFQSIAGVVSWQKHGADWHVAIPDFRWLLLGTEGQGSVSLELPKEGSPLLKLGARFTAHDATKLKPYMPLQWGHGLQDWLRHGVVAARVARGQLTIEGPMADFPFHKTNNGIFKLDLDVADARVDFHPDWPTLENLNAHLKFLGNGLAIDAVDASLLGAKVEKITARFADFHEAKLVIVGHVAADVARLYKIVQASPLMHNLGTLVRRTRATGPAQVDLHLDIPLQHAVETEAAGTVHLDNVILQYLGLKEPVRGISGDVGFGPQGTTSESISGKFYELPVQGRITAESPHLSRLVAEFRYALQADGTGVSELVPPWILSQLEGESAWRAELPIGGEGDGALRLSTDLQGVSVNFPEPLAKDADETIPLVLRFSGDEKIPLRIGVEYQDRLSGDLHFTAPNNAPLSLTSGLLKFGGGGAVASENGMIVTGHAGELDIAAWSAALKAVGGSEKVAAVKRVELSVDQPILGGQTLLPTRIRYTPSAGGWQALVDGAGAQGELSWQDTPDGGVVRAQLQHLAMNYHGMDKGSEGQTDGGPQPPLDPGQFPRLDLDCASLHVGDVDFGHLQMVTDRVPDGQKLSQFKLGGAALDADASGQWWRRQGQSGASLVFHLASTQTADVLRALGYTPSLTAKQSKFDGDLLWAPSAAGLELAQARGHVTLEIENGQLKAIEPGAGRVLGLLNFYALPRRLLFNFRDVLGEGLGFDKITGSFDVADGDAHTDDLLIAGPSVRMETRGRIGLAAHDYDQRIKVYPDVSSGVTLGALLIGGPALGALALLAQQVLDKPLSSITQLSYHLGGTWDNPEVKRIDSDESSKGKRKVEGGKPVPAPQ